jgi:hypothetical protein
MWYRVLWELLTTVSEELHLHLQYLQYNRICFICSLIIQKSWQPSTWGQQFQHWNFGFLLEKIVINETGKSQGHAQIDLQKYLYFSCCCVCWQLFWYSNFLSYDNHRKHTRGPWWHWTSRWRRWSDYSSHYLCSPSAGAQTDKLPVMISIGTIW